MRFVDDDEGTVICPECTSEAILEASSEEFEEARPENLQIQRRLVLLGKLNATDVLNIWLIVILMLSVGAFIMANRYLAKSAPTITVTEWAVQNAGTPLQEMSLYLAAIFKFAAENNGNYPESLEKLYPGYVDKEIPTVLATSDRYTYAADRNSGFVLTCPVADRFGFVKLFATKEGVIHLE
jgi:hypothetical protein